MFPLNCHCLSGRLNGLRGAKQMLTIADVGAYLQNGRRAVPAKFVENEQMLFQIHVFTNNVIVLTLKHDLD